MSAEKTNLQVYHVLEDQQYEYNPLKINGVTIPFVDQAEHVGVVRSPSGNGPALLARMSAHQKALAAVMHSGIALSHRANPTYSLKVEKLYAMPVLFSGLASLVFSKDEVNLLEKHYLLTIQRLLRLHDKTPRCVVYFLAGTLPGNALLHLRQLNLFGMICRLPNNILNNHAKDIFSTRLFFKGSWFEQIANLCEVYHLPQPLMMLNAPLSKMSLKNLVKKKVINYWEVKLREEGSNLSSLKYFNPFFMSLSKVHPLWLTAGHSPFKVSMALIQAKMLSGRYRCGYLTRHWSNSDGTCKITPECHGMST